MTSDADDQRFMALALELAARGEGCRANPMVGCVLVRDGQIVGEGWHQEFGGPHAEINAIKQAGSKTVSATAYVTLEPCCHQGKTPPCTKCRRSQASSESWPRWKIRFRQSMAAGLQSSRRLGSSAELVCSKRRRGSLMPYLKRITTGKAMGDREVGAIG